MRFSKLLSMCLFAGCATAACLFSGCATDDEVVTTEPSSEWTKLDDVVVESDEPTAYDDPCAQLPADGLCAWACDPIEFQKRIAPGSCVEIRCELRDGREIFASGCASVEP